MADDPRLTAIREARDKIGGVVTVLDVDKHGSERANAVDLVWSSVPYLLDLVASHARAVEGRAVAYKHGEETYLTSDVTQHQDGGAARPHEPEQASPDALRIQVEDLRAALSAKDQQLAHLQAELEKR